MANDDRNERLSIGEYLIRRLQDYGIRDVFGIPGDYVLSFYTMLEQSPLNIVGCTREDCAGFAADAYARVHGMGALCVTYCVGGLSVCNSIAGAYAEKSPVVMIYRLARHARADSQPAPAPHGAQLSHAVRRVRKAVLRRHRARSTRSPRSARSIACWPRALATSGRCISRSPATWCTCGRRRRRRTRARKRRATRGHSTKR